MTRREALGQLLHITLSPLIVTPVAIGVCSESAIHTIVPVAMPPDPPQFVMINEWGPAWTPSGDFPRMFSDEEWARMEQQFASYQVEPMQAFGFSDCAAFQKEFDERTAG